MQFSYPPRPSKKRTQWLSELKVGDLVAVLSKYQGQGKYVFWEDILVRVTWVSLSGIKIGPEEFDATNGKSITDLASGVKYLFPLTPEIISAANTAYFSRYLKVNVDDLTDEQVNEIAKVLGWRMKYVM